MTDAQAVSISTRHAEATRSARHDDRWLFVDGAHAFGGHEIMLLRWLEELAAQSTVSTCLLAREGSQLARQASAYAKVVTLPRQRAGAFGRVIQEIRDIARFARTALRVRPHLCIVAEGCLLSQPTFAVAARLMRLRVVEYVPLLQTSTSMGFGSGPIRDTFVRHVYRRLLHGWITITNQQAEDFRRWSGVRRPILTLPNTVSRSIESATRVVQSVRNADDLIRILVLGRIEAHQKGLDTLLHYLIAHPEHGERMRVTFVGNGPYEPMIATRLEVDPVLARWVSLKGWSSPVDALRSHDVLLMVSRYEGVPLVMLEAMALEVPVIAPDLPGTCGFLDASSLFPVGDIDAAFVRLERLAEPAFRHDIVSRNKMEFERRASNAAFGVAVRTLTQELRALSRPRRRSA